MASETFPGQIGAVSVGVGHSTISFQQSPVYGIAVGDVVRIEKKTGYGLPPGYFANATVTEVYSLTDVRVTGIESVNPALTPFGTGCEITRTFTTYVS